MAHPSNPTAALRAEPLGRERRYRVALFGGFGCGNFGNDATLEACLAGLRPLTALSKVLCVATDPDNVTALYGIVAEPLLLPTGRLPRASLRIVRIVVEGARQLRALLRARKLLRDVVTLVVAGTGVIDDQHTRPTQLPLDVLRWSLAARLAGSRLVFLSVGAGPIEHPLSRVFLMLALRLAHSVSFRDQRSLEFVRSVGRQVAGDRVLPDLVLANVPAERKPCVTNDGVRCVAIGVLGKMNWQTRPAAYQSYEDRMVGLAARFARNGWRVRLITGDNADIDTQQAVHARPELQGLEVEAVATRSFADVLDTARHAAAMIASRYHNVVAAVLAGVPVVSLAYGLKNQALLEQLGIGAWNHHIDDFDVEQVFSQIELATANPAPLYRNELAAYRIELASEFERLCREQ
jgi:polysaccharide pyruvyl transferase WcaK-like protein